MKTKQQLKKISDLESGDIVVGKSSGLSYVVTDNYGDYVIAVRTQHITNPLEWEVIKADSQEQNQQ